MENTDLALFYRSVTTWPRGRAETAVVAERVLDLLRPTFAALLVANDPESSGYKVAEGGASGIPDPAKFIAFLRKQAMQTPVGPLRVKQFQLSRDRVPWTSVLPAYHLSICLISGEPKVAPGAREGGGRKDYGWLVLGTNVPLAPKEEFLLIAAAQRLSELAVSRELEDALALQTQFLSIASHELKTPLTSIYGILQLQERMLRPGKQEKEAAPDRERHYSLLKMAIRQVERLNDLINGLLNVSRIQSGRFMVEPSDSDVAGVLRETVNSRLNVIAQEAGVKLTVDAPPALSAWVDPVRMEEVITNLVMNAIRFSPEGGVVWIKLKGENEHLRLLIRDQGPSVPPEDRERIFQPFERAQRTTRLGGLGLGLFISRQIARLHGGEVWLAESVPGKGNVFEAVFPLRHAGAISA